MRCQCLRHVMVDDETIEVCGMKRKVRARRRNLSVEIENDCWGRSQSWPAIYWISAPAFTRREERPSDG